MIQVTMMATDTHTALLHYLLGLTTSTHLFNSTNYSGKITSRQRQQNLTELLLIKNNRNNVTDKKLFQHIPISTTENLFLLKQQVGTQVKILIYYRTATFNLVSE